MDNKEFVCMSPKSKTVMEYLKPYYGDYGTFTEENYQIYITWLMSPSPDILNEIRVFGLGVYSVLASK